MIRGAHPGSAVAIAFAVAGLVAAGLVGAGPGRARVVSVPSDASAEELQSILSSATAGDEVRLGGGTWTGHFRVERAVHLIGESALLDGGGTGTVLVVDAPGAIVEGLRIRGSGHDLGGPDSGVYVTPASTRAVIRDLEIEDCAFGIWVHQTLAAVVAGNRIRGRSELHPSTRGNGIHLFDSDSLLVRDNHISGARDGIYISATDDSRFERNLVEDQRFGIHYMFSQRNTLRENVSRRNNGAYALMQSSDLLVVGNRAEASRERGILFRDAQRCVIRDNVIVGGAEGMFFYSSTENEIIGNRIEGNEIGAKIWAGTLRNVIRDNDFIGNRRQVFFVSSSDLFVGEEGRGNYWSDYLGWDQDGDGIGDRPYRVDSFTADLLYRFPSAALLLRSPALELLAHLQERRPFLRVPTVVDLAPRIESGIR